MEGCILNIYEIRPFLQKMRNKKFGGLKATFIYLLWVMDMKDGFYGAKC